MNNYKLEVQVVFDEDFMFNRSKSYTPTAAMKVASDYSRRLETTSIVFFRCKELKIEEKISFKNGKICGIRTKYNRKDVEEYDDEFAVPHWEEFCELIDPNQQIGYFIL